MTKHFSCDDVAAYLIETGMVPVGDGTFTDPDGLYVSTPTWDVEKGTWVASTIVMEGGE